MNEHVDKKNLKILFGLSSTITSNSSEMKLIRLIAQYTLQAYNQYEQMRRIIDMKKTTENT